MGEGAPTAHRAHRSPGAACDRRAEAARLYHAGHRARGGEAPINDLECRLLGPDTQFPTPSGTPGSHKRKPWHQVEGPKPGRMVHLRLPGSWTSSTLFP